MLAMGIIALFATLVLLFLAVLVGLLAVGLGVFLTIFFIRRHRNQKPDALGSTSDPVTQEPSP
jgi:hypothetical protein